MNLIVAVDQNFGIGSNNTLLYNLPADLQYFKQKTLNKVVVMGYNTLLTLPGGKPLKNRINIVLYDVPKAKIENAIVVNSLQMLFSELKNYNSNDIFIIGGAYVYEQLLPYCEIAFITQINSTKPADKFFPNVNKMPKWEKVEKSSTQTENGVSFNYLTYKNLAPLPY